MHGYIALNAPCPPLLPTAQQCHFFPDLTPCYRLPLNSVALVNSWRRTCGFRSRHWRKKRPSRSSSTRPGILRCSNFTQCFLFCGRCPYTIVPPPQDVPRPLLRQFSTTLLFFLEFMLVNRFAAPRLLAPFLLSSHLPTPILLAWKCVARRISLESHV